MPATIRCRLLRWRQITKAIATRATTTLAEPSVHAAISRGRLMAAGTDGFAKVVVALVAMALVIWRHRGNLQRIVAGSEPKIGQKS